MSGNQAIPLTKKISGWGGYPIQDAHIYAPVSSDSFKSQLYSLPSVITRGMGRSYGDSANANNVLHTQYLDHFIAFDRNKGLLTLESGVRLRDVLKIIVKEGWFLPVTPGTSFVTIGGAIASDVHGKNHHLAGTFGQHVVSMTILLGNGEIVTASSTQLPDLFNATCGGMGLTGVILNATIQLIPIKSSLITQKTIKAVNLENACEALEENNNSTYSVAWIDCLTTGKNLGRSILMTGEHADSGELDIVIKHPVSIPVYTPSILLNSVSMKTFNRLYFAKAKHNEIQGTSLFSYFYPLDALGNWNRLYGKNGFLQYQFVLPKTDGINNMRTILKQIAQSSLGSFLAVLKQFGPANNHLLSFPLEGFTLALDFKLTSNTVGLLHRLDNLIVGMGGKVYLAKDAVMTEATFKSTYTKWYEFEEIREKYSAIGKFASAQSRRLGLA